MSSAIHSTSEHSGFRGPCSFFHSEGGRWSVVNTVAVVAGFILFWPLGLVMLFWVLSGRDVRALPGSVRDMWHQFRGNGESRGFAGSDNVVFREYQQIQYDRIREIQQEIRERTRRFNAFRADARRRADQAEFDDFMSNNSTSV